MKKIIKTTECQTNTATPIVVDIPVILTPHSGHIDPPGVLVSKSGDG